MEPNQSANELTETLVNQIEKEICLLFHQYATTDLDIFNFEELYQLPYWEYLDLQDIGLQRRHFIRDGCLMLILRMADQLFWTPDSPHRHKIQLCRDAIIKLDTTQDRARKLSHMTLMILDAAEHGDTIQESLCDEIRAVENEVLLEYFRRMSRHVREKSHPYTISDYDEVSLERFQRQAESAYDRLYSVAPGSSEAAALCNECKESMQQAISWARKMGLEQKAIDLEERLAHYKAVFRSQFSR